MTTGNSESELWSAIAVFERILETNPTDRQALETLADACARLGDVTRSLQYLDRLVDVVAQDRDLAAARALLERLRTMGHAEGLVSLRKRVEAMVSAGAAAARPEPPALRRAVDVTREVALAWDLLQARLIAQDIYARTVQELTDLSTQPKDQPVTTLQVLLELQFEGLDRILAHLAKTTKTPFLAIAGFELVRETFSLLPMELITNRGALPFERMNEDLLVAVLNPADQSLREEVRRLSRRTCHFYLTHPSDYNLALASIRKILSAPP